MTGVAVIRVMTIAAVIVEVGVAVLAHEPYKCSVTAFR
jgi:hypothetical protein